MDYAPEIAAAPLAVLAKRLQAAETERDEYRDANNSVRVCAAHTRDIIDGDDCLICSLATAEAALRQILEEFASRSAPTGYDEADPVVVIVRAALGEDAT